MKDHPTPPAPTAPPAAGQRHSPSRVSTDADSRVRALIPVDPVALRAKADDLRREADAWSSSGGRMRRVDDPSWRGNASDAYRAGRDAVAADMEATSDNVRRATAALADFTNRAETLQGQARDGFLAQDAANLSHAQAKRDAARAGQPLDPAAVTRLQNEQLAATATISRAQAQFSTACDDLGQVLMGLRRGLPSEQRKVPDATPPAPVPPPPATPATRVTPAGNPPAGGGSPAPSTIPATVNPTTSDTSRDTSSADKKTDRTGGEGSTQTHPSPPAEPKAPTTTPAPTTPHPPPQPPAPPFPPLVPPAPTTYPNSYPGEWRPLPSPAELPPPGDTPAPQPAPPDPQPAPEADFPTPHDPPFTPPAPPDPGQPQTAPPTPTDAGQPQPPITPDLTDPHFPPPGAPETSNPSQPDAPAPPPPAPVIRDDGAKLGTGTFLAVSVVAALAAAAVIWRARHRSRYRPGSGKRDQLDMPPISRRLTAAYNEHEHDRDDDQAQPQRHDQNHGQIGDTDQRPTARPATHPHADHDPAGDSDGWEPLATDHTEHSNPAQLPDQPQRHAPDQPGGLPVGAVGGQVVTVDPCATAGIGVHGVYAPSVLRAIMLTSLAGDPRDPARPPGEVLITSADVAELLGTATPTAPARLRVTPDLDEVLTALRAEAEQRAGLADTTGLPALMLILTNPPTDPHAARQLTETLQMGRAVGISAVVLGPWPAGHISVTGQAADAVTVSATQGPCTHLQGARLYTVRAAEMLDMLTQLAPPPEPAAEPTDQPATEPAHQQATAAPVDEPAAPPITSADVNTPPAEEPQPATAPAPAPVVVSPGTPTPEDVDQADPPNNTAENPAEETTGATVGDTPASQTARSAGRLRLEVLGPVRLLWTPPPTSEDDRPTASQIIARGRRAELLAYLAVHRRGVRRETIAADMWRDEDSQSPTSAIATVISRARDIIRRATSHAVSEPIVTTGDGACALDPTIEVDYWEYVDALTESRLTTTSQERNRAAERVLDLYRDELAASISAEWIEAPRQEALREVLDAANALADDLMGTDVHRALTVLKRARKIDPYNEAVYQRMISAYLQLGHRDAATRTYKLLEEQLAELGAEPDHETQRLIGPIPARNERASSL